MTQLSDTQAGTEVPQTEAFPALADGYRRELTAHCYRMTGSIHDAEDLVQETYLRAWRAYGGFEGRSSVRTWLYRIATNVCLTALEGKDRRPLPTGLGAPASEPGDALASSNEISWLEPAPDPMVAGESCDPASIVGQRESIRLAFIAALQHLPARQRAVLILRDVLRWKASEVAAALDTTEAAVNSALQRAHAQLSKADLSQDTLDTTLDAEKQAMLDRYVKAFWDKDITAIVGMLTADAVWEMPPFTGWYSGAEAIGRLIDTQCPGGTNDMPMVATTANGQPAFGLYMRQPDGTFAPFHLQVLTLRGTQVEHVAAFFDLELFAKFGLPATLPADHLVTR
ncbi:RNA polymerase subunit sigma-70 [Phycicoccus sp. Root563]|uniref:sigma-70 family RNA polymerase sigma factor n=1 Tax=Phycicoccus sp. Root563 TaxID=1736562 RepID=UPI000703A6CA|nr:sigma-70 family RNA polymerase sigma factor [Phycicoccus sp. Root563]KQZ87622.1 RNA polymerase subunit sigma-70 [Phycicoccus sp. Root563]